MQGRNTPAGAADAQAKTKQAECPTFTLVAGQRGHLRALISVIDELPNEQRSQAVRTLRDFELWEEANR